MIALRCAYTVLKSDKSVQAVFNIALTDPWTIGASGALVDNMFSYINRDDDELKVFLLYKNYTDMNWNAMSCGIQNCLFNSTDLDSWQDEDFPNDLISSSDENSFQSAIRQGFKSKCSEQSETVNSQMIIFESQKAILNTVSHWPMNLFC